MIKVFYGMPQSEVDKYAQVKSEIIKARNAMSAESIQVAKDEIMHECRVYDYDPENTANLYTVKDGIATIPIAGMLVNKVDFCAAFFGETITTYKFIQESTAKALKDSSVQSIEYDVNSGGGVVSGVDETSQVIRSSSKPTKAIVRDMAASAAYWLASATDEIVVASNAAFIGSIGVAVEVINRDKADEKNGVKRQTLTNTTSSDKRPNLSTEDGQAVLIKELDDIFNVFSESILIKRSDKLSMESIQDLSGRVLIAKDAIEYGLADKMQILEGSGDIVIKSNGGNTPQSADVNKVKGANSMSLQDILKENPEAKAEYDDAIKAAKGEAVKADRERISGIMGLAGVSFTAEIKEAVETGMTDGDFAKEEIVRQNQRRAEASKDSNGGALNASGQLPKKPVKDEKKAKEEATAAAVKAYLNKGEK